jgi:NAD(P)H dehydrogenase (quinone)
MKRCVVFYSKTGNTATVAEKFKDFDLLRVQAETDDPNNLNPVLTVKPDLSTYDYVVIATPVHGFQISQVMKTYLTEVSSLEGKVIDLFVTHFFPFAWMGGNVSLKQMRRLIEQKSGSVRYMTSINWKNKHRESDIEKMVTTYHA